MLPISPRGTDAPWCAWSAGPAAQSGGRAAEGTRLAWNTVPTTVVMLAAPCSRLMPQRGVRPATRVRAPSASPQENASVSWRDLTQTTAWRKQTLMTPQHLITPLSPPAALMAPCSGTWWTATVERMKTARCQCCWSLCTAISSRSSSPKKRSKRGLCAWGGRSPD